jgi:hypothetical protein
MSDQISAKDWLSSWPDALAFGIGLAVAWWAGWSTGDLVWSLWLSSLVVGYSTIVWMIARPAIELGAGAWRERLARSTDPRAIWLLWTLIFVGAAFFLAFFTIHFVFFHYVHSQIMISFFPIETGHGRSTNANMATYVEIVRRYWVFLPSAFMAHRAAFLRKPLSFNGQGSMASLVRQNRGGALFSEPYRNVVRMHLLIFFFFFAHLAKLENFAVYAVVYAVYFFPWRLVRRRSLATPVSPIDARTPTQLRAV